MVKHKWKQLETCQHVTHNLTFELTSCRLRLNSVRSTPSPSPSVQKFLATIGWLHDLSFQFLSYSSTFCTRSWRGVLTACVSHRTSASERVHVPRPRAMCHVCLDSHVSPRCASTWVFETKARVFFFVVLPCGSPLPVSRKLILPRSVCICYQVILNTTCDNSKHKRHIVYIYFVLRRFPRRSPCWAGRPLSHALLPHPSRAPKPHNLETAEDAFQRTDGGLAGLAG